MSDTEVTRKEALLRVYRTINGPAKAGPKWVTYSRGQVDAVMDVVKQMLNREGFRFGPAASAESSEVAK